jgi:invasion protein IalB
MHPLRPTVCSLVSLLLVQSAAAETKSPAPVLSDNLKLQLAQAATPGPAPSAAPAPQPAPQNQPAEKVETINFDSWILSCREFVEGPKKRNCAMTVSVRKSDTNRTVLSWTVRQAENGQIVSVIEALPGISIAPGIQLKLDKGAAVRKFPIETCEPNWCSASLPMDKAFIREVATSSKVTIVVTSSAGQPFTFEFPINGFEKAYAKM